MIEGGNVVPVNENEVTYEVPTDEAAEKTNDETYVTA